MSHWRSSALKPLDELKPNLVLTEEEFRASLPKKTPFQIAFDVETSSLDCEQGCIVGFSYSWEPNIGYYIPIEHQIGQNCSIKTPLFKIYQIMKIAQSVFIFNFRFECRYMAKYGFDLLKVKHFDVGILTWNMDSNIKDQSLKFATRHYLGYEQPTYEETVGNAANFGFVDPQVAAPYGSYDSICTYLLAKKLGPILQKEAPFVLSLDNKVDEPILLMENTKIPVNTGYLTGLYDELTKKMQQTEMEAWNIAGTHFNIGSGPQVSQVLLNFGLTTGANTKRGDLVTRADLLEKVDHPLPKKIVEYRQHLKLRNSYVDVLRGYARGHENTVRFNYMTTHAPCLTEESQIYSRRLGLTSIKNVEVDDYVWTRFGWDRVVGTKITENVIVYKMKLQNGVVLEGTGHHPVLTYGGVWRGIEDYRPDDLVQMNTNPIPELPIQKIIYKRNLGLKPFVYDRIAIPEFVTEDLAEILGFIAGDGSILKDGVKLCFNPNESLSFIDYYCSLFERLFGVKRHKGDISGGSLNYKYCSVAIVDFLKFLETKDNKAPALIKRSGRSVISAWLRGLFDADGGVKVANCNRCVSLSNNKHGLVDDVKLFLNLLGIDTQVNFKGLKDKNPRKDLRVRTTTDNSLFREIVGFQSPSKKNLISGVKKTSLSYGSSSVDSTTSEGVDTVYDISLENSHEFIANGVIVHNTGRFAASGEKKNDFFTSINIQSLPKAESKNFECWPSDEEDALYGWKFNLWLKKDLDQGHKFVEGYDPDLSVRKSFHAPKDYVFFHLDYSGQEIRIAACLSGEKNWIQAFLDGDDIHKRTAILVWGAENYNRDMRKRAKFINFGSLYGGTKYTVARQIGCSVEEADKFLSEWRRALPQLNGWLAHQIKEARKRGTIYTAFGRPRRLMEFYAQGTKKMTGFADRSAMNSPVQGTAADLMRLYLGKSLAILRKYGDKLIFVSMIHDEANYYIHKDAAIEIIPQILEAATFIHPKWPIPIAVDFELGYSWGEMWAFEIENEKFVPKFLEVA